MPGRIKCPLTQQEPTVPRQDDEPPFSGDRPQSAPPNHAAESVINKRRAFLELTDTDLERVQGLAVAFHSFLDTFVDQFYAHLFAHPETASLLTDRELVARLKQAQRHYFETLVHAQIDAGYAEERWQIGRAHAEVGLEPQWFLGAYNQYIQYCFQQYARHCEGDLDRYVAGTLSLMKILLLDMGLALDAYFDRSTDQLRTALEMLAQSNTELKEFARLASHDLKTPLATVAGYCEEFLDEFGAQVPEQGRALIEAARHRTLQLSRTINDLLALSEASAQPGQRERVATRRLLDEVLERLRPDIERRPVRIALPDQLPDVWAHPARLHEVFFNLMSNAVKFVDKIPGMVELSVVSQGALHVFCVRDNGPGIAEPDQTKIFAPFRRLPQHRDLPGSGLGLYFAKSIVEEQGGRVWVESKLGDGCRFFVALPAAPPV
jgi:signal transduction histidine kinase